MATASFTCATCGRTAKREAGAINRAQRNGLNLYCGRVCSGIGRRKGKTVEQKKAEKREYDKQYRERNRAALKRKKAEYFKRTYDPAQAAVERRKRRASHAEYCRRPEYKAWKREYDRKHRAKRRYGALWECFLLFQDIETEVLSRMSRYQVAYLNEATNKSQRRRRELWKNSLPVT